MAGGAAVWVESILAGMSLKEKLAQVQCAGLSGRYVSDTDPQLLQAIDLARRGVGMFVVYGGTPRDVAHLTNLLQKHAEVPLIFTADYENGAGHQMEGASHLPPNMAFAAAGSEDLTRRAAAMSAMEGRACGIHGTYSPVADTIWDPENPAESVRSFGGDLKLHARMIRANVDGYQRSRKQRHRRMFNVSKHFPGRGDVKLIPGESHWTYINKPADVVLRQDIGAFRNAIAAGVTGIMTEHIAVPSLTGGKMIPASVSPELVTGYLHGKLGFKGIVWSDDLWYPHVVERFGAQEVALLAIEAGHDVILKAKDPMAAVSHIAKAVSSGRISEHRIDGSVRKILALKYWLGLDVHENRFVDVAKVGKCVGTPENAALVQKAADRSVTLLRNDGVLPLKKAMLSGVKIVNVCIQRMAADTAPMDLAAQLAAAFPGICNFHIRPDMSDAYYKSVSKAIDEADVVFFSLFVPRIWQGDAAPLAKKDIALIQTAVAAKPKRVVVMSYGNPHLIRKLPRVRAFLVGWGEGGWCGPREPYFRSFIKVVKGELKPTGKLPVEVSKRYPIGFGLRL